MVDIGERESIVKRLNAAMDCLLIKFLPDIERVNELKKEYADAVDKISASTSYGGNPMACAAALASIEVIEEEGSWLTPPNSVNTSQGAWRIGRQDTQLLVKHAAKVV
jgi:hypothetical protein